MRRTSDIQILIVDDNEDNLAILERNLAKEGYVLHLANSGHKAFNMISQIQIDLILLDIMMTHMDGIEVLRHLKSNAKTEGIPVIMVTAVKDSSSVKACIALGAQGYFLKPFDMPTIKSRIREILSLDE